MTRPETRADQNRYPFVRFLWYDSNSAVHTALNYSYDPGSNLSREGGSMIALNLTDIKKVTSHLFLKDTFDNFSFNKGRRNRNFQYFPDRRIYPERFLWHRNRALRIFHLEKSAGVLLYYYQGQTYSFELPVYIQPFSGQYRKTCRPEHSIHPSGKCTGIIHEPALWRETAHLRDRHVV